MYKIKKEFHFCAAHRLPNHHGRCRFIHGHNYKVIVKAVSDQLNDQEMVMDFKDFSKIVNDYLQNTYDHRLILSKNDPMLDIIMKSFPIEQCNNIHVFENVPTAENMAETFKADLTLIFDKMTDPEEYGYDEIKIEEVEVFETPSASAIY